MRFGLKVVGSRQWVLSGLLGALLLSGRSAPAQSGADPAVLERYSDEAQKALAAGQYGEAEAAYKHLLALRPDLAEIHVTLGAMYFQEKRYEQSVSELRTALKLKPGLRNVTPLLSMSLSELGQYEKALPGLEAAFRDSADPKLRRMCGLELVRAYTGLQQNDKAVSAALQLDRLYPNDPEVLYHTAKVYGNLAFLNMRSLAAAAPSSVWRHLAAAEAFESQGSYDQAIGDYRQVLTIEPQRPGIHYRLGRTLLARSNSTHSTADAASAAQEFELELKQDPDNANAAYELAEIHRKANELDTAREYFERALKNYPGFEEAQLGLAATLMAMQKPQLALPHLHSAIEIDAKDEVAWYRLSQAERAVGDVAEQKKALAEFQRLHSADPYSIKASEALVSPSEVTKQQLDPNALQ